MLRSLSPSTCSKIPRYSIFSNIIKTPCPWHSVNSAFTSTQIENCFQQLRSSQTQSTSVSSIPFGKQLKEEFKEKRREQRAARKVLNEKEAAWAAKSSKWDLTVGLELHVQLNTEAKLFSASRTSIDDPPNTNVSFFDLALPGSQPIFQTATLIPALRAAVALGCRIETESGFDRKHYFYPDQPSGYQITQYYKPIARGGQISIPSPDSTTDDIVIGIRQIQLEQDTAKSTSHSPSATLVDFNRVGHPLIEIITLPEIHSPRTAAECARKIQSVLQSANAIFTGMEMGGLRVDVNVSVSPKGSTELGQRTEIKNISSFKAIEQAIIAEQDRQIDILENGGSVAGETRGWALGDTSTTRLRGKEGEVDYRYMPDPDIPPLRIADSLITHIRNTLPPLPDQTIQELHFGSGLDVSDAKILLALDGGERLEYFDAACALLYQEEKIELMDEKAAAERLHLSRTVANWVIHEFGGLLSSTARSFSPSIVPPKTLAQILQYLLHNEITGTSAKRLLSIVFNGDERDVKSIIEAEGMNAPRMSDHGYQKMAEDLVAEHPEKVAQIRKGQAGKLKFLVGQMKRNGGSNLDAVKAESALKMVLKL